MKKVSTAATKQGGNISRQRLTIGLDLGDRNSWYRMLDEAGQIQVEHSDTDGALICSLVAGVSFTIDGRFG